MDRAVIPDDLQLPPMLEGNEGLMPPPRRVASATDKIKDYIRDSWRLIGMVEKRNIFLVKMGRYVFGQIAKKLEPGGDNDSSVGSDASSSSEDLPQQRIEIFEANENGSLDVLLADIEDKMGLVKSPAHQEEIRDAVMCQCGRVGGQLRRQCRVAANQVQAAANVLPNVAMVNAWLEKCQQSGTEN